MATPQFNIKTGSDSSAYFAREKTIADTTNENELGMIKLSEDVGTDYLEYPVLVRRTGDSLKGTTESIESNELRKGRTKSAPRKGNESSEGSLDFEFSPETYDDILAATFRNEWVEWNSDKNSATNLDKLSYADGYFSMKKLDANGKVVEVKKRLVATPTEVATIKTEIAAGTKTELDLPLIELKDADKMEIAELTCGSKDIKYDVIKEFAGDGNALYQDFAHLAVNTIDISVTPGQIVTGSFGFVGSTNPRLLQKDALAKSMLDKFDGADDTEKEANAKAYIENLPDKGTSTDQYTAREGFLYIDGERVRYGSNLSFNLNNGLEKTFAIFEKDAIAVSPLTLDITGSLGAYLISGYTETLYNLSKDDKDVEVLFCFQDKEEDPDSLYVVQIFKTKFTDTDISSGAENLEVTFPFQSFEERACRIIRLRRQRVKKLSRTDDTNIEVTLSKVPSASVADDIKVSAVIDGVDVDSADITVTVGSTNDVYTVTIANASKTKDLDVTVEYNDTKVTKSYEKE